MATRDEIEQAINDLADNAHAIGWNHRHADKTQPSVDHVMALIEPLLAAPPAPGEVRLTLSREDAEWWRNVIDKADCWGSEHEAARVLDVLTAALNAAAAPGER